MLFFLQSLVFSFPKTKQIHSEKEDYQREDERTPGCHTESNPLRVQERRTSSEGHTCVRGGKTGSCPDLTGILEKLTHLPPGRRDKRHHWTASLAESGPQSGRWRRLSWWPADPTSERAALSVLLAFCSLISAARLWPLLVHVCTSYQLNLPLTL